MAARYALCAYGFEWNPASTTYNRGVAAPRLQVSRRESREVLSQTGIPTPARAGTERSYGHSLTPAPQFGGAFFLTQKLNPGVARVGARDPAYFGAVAYTDFTVGEKPSRPGGGHV
jgi:hypothetical protein